MLRGENASAKSLHSVVQTLESDKVKLELKVKNLELQLKENKRQLSSSSGNDALPSAAQLPCPFLSQHLAKGLVTSVLGVVASCCVTVRAHIRPHMMAAIIQANHEASKCKAARRTEITLVGAAGVQP